MGRVTGIGVIGKNSLLLNSKHGPRLMLGGVVITADLPAGCFPEIDELGCPADCTICADVCPVQAISIKDKRVRIMTCLGHTSRTPQMSKLRFFVLNKLKPESATRFMNLKAFDEHTFHICSECVSPCPYGKRYI